jgi:ComF family protein
MGAIRMNPKPHCLSCGRSMRDSRAVCPECRKARFHFERAFSACLYEGALKEIVHQFKYSGRPGLLKTLTLLMVDFLKNNREVLAGIDAVTFVPLQPGRVRGRGFNQSRLLAAGIAAEAGVPLLDTLAKRRATKPQNELSRDERLRNLKGAFSARRDVRLKGLNLLLVDDVMTTGATLDECAGTLVGAGAGKVRCLTLARGA